MRHLVKITAVSVVLCIALVACSMGKKPEEQILGKWMDSPGTYGYEFAEEGQVTILFLDMNFEKTGSLTILDSLLTMVNQTFPLEYQGSYIMDTEAETITLTYTVLGQSIRSVYQYRFEESSLVLTDQKDHSETVLFRSGTEAESTTE